VADIRVIVYQSTSANPYAVSINYLWRPAQDTSSSAVETNPHFVGRFTQPQLLILPLLRQQQDWASSSVFAAQPETNTNFIARFQPPAYNVLRALRQNFAFDYSSSAIETNVSFVGRFTQPQYSILSALRQNQAITIPLPPQSETNPPFIGKFTQPQYIILPALRQQQDWASTFQFAGPMPTHFNFLGVFKPYKFFILQSLRQQVETAFSGPVPPPVVRGMYRLLSDHWLADPTGQNVYHTAGDIINEGIDVPFGWPPTLASEPLNDQAIRSYWNIGPRGMFDAEPQRDFYVQPFNLVPPVVKWARTAPGSPLYVLTGAGAYLGARDARDPPIAITNALPAGTVVLTSESGSTLTSESGTILTPG